MDTELDIVVFVNNYNWPVVVPYDKFRDKYELTEQYINQVITSECLTRHVLTLKTEVEMKILGFDGPDRFNRIRDKVNAYRVTKILIG